MQSAPHRVPQVDPSALDRLPAGVRLIDLRSPVEFARDRIPGACNVPLFDDAERALIGTLYARESPEAAFEAARSRTLETIAAFTKAVYEALGMPPPALSKRTLRECVQAFTDGGMVALEDRLQPIPDTALEPGAVLLHCWRGGLRSQSATAFLRAVGLNQAVALEGGYKAYRAFVRQRLDGWDPPPCVVLRGLTGVGKTLVLRALEDLRPGWTLDLEALAGHRSSILGMVGLEPCSQKTFESRLWARLAQGFPGVCVMEGESRKVGDRILPARVWEALCGGRSLELVAPLERRIQVLIDDYLARESNRVELRERLPFLEERLGPRFQGRLIELLDSDSEAELVRMLLKHYYDPLYLHSEGAFEYRARIDASDPERAAHEIASWIADHVSGSLFAHF